MWNGSRTSGDASDNQGFLVPNYYPLDENLLRSATVNTLSKAHIYLLAHIRGAYLTNDVTSTYAVDGGLNIRN